MVSFLFCSNYNISKSKKQTASGEMQHVTSFTVETTLNNICFYSEWKNKAV